MKLSELFRVRRSTSTAEAGPIKISVLFRKHKLILLLGVLLLVMILISMNGEEDSDARSGEVLDVQQYSEALTADLEELLSSVSGVGTCQVFITFSDAGERVYAYDEDLSESESGKVAENKQYVLISSRSDGLILKIRSPSVSGVAVVCDGGDNTRVKSDVTDVVSRTLGITADRISVKKRTLRE